MKTIVIGGGLVGVATAYELATAGGDVTVVDRADVGRATTAGAGILSPATSTAPDAPFIALGEAAGRHYEDLAARLRVDGELDVAYARCGSLRVALVDTDVDEFDAQLPGLVARTPSLRVVDGDEIRSLIDTSVAPVLRALYNPDACRVDGHAFAAALTRAAQRRGVRFIEGTVDALTIVDGHVTHAVVNGADDAADAVVIAGGAWSSIFAAQLGVPLAVHPVRGQILHLRLPGARTETWPIIQTVLGLYAVPWEDGRVAIGATAEPEAAFDARVTAKGVHMMLSAAHWLLPDFKDATYLETRVGLRPVSSDDRPIIGAIPGIDNVFVNTGHGANGLLLAPLSGAAVADVVLGRSPRVDVAAFSISRFG